MNESEKARLRDALEQEHRQQPHEGLDEQQLGLHLAIHMVVEQQLHVGEPPQVRDTLERLLQRGMERHEAIHSMGQVVADELLATLADGQQYDEERYVEQLRRLEEGDLTRC